MVLSQSLGYLWHNKILYFSVPRAQVFTFQRRFYIFSGFHQIIELKTSKHEFADIIDPNKKGFVGKKLSEGQAGRNSLRFNSNCFLTSILVFSGGGGRGGGWQRGLEPSLHDRPS